MCEVNYENFSKNLETLEKALKEAKFVALDTEFSALNPLGFSNNSLFDTGEERYEKLRKSLEHVVPLEMGISAFSQSGDVNTFVAKSFVFYLFPRPFASLNKTFFYQASSVEFLCSNKFNFDKVNYSGISFLNRSEEDKLKGMLEDESLNIMDSSMRLQVEETMERYLPELREWFNKAEYGSTYVLEGNLEDYFHSIDFKYFFHLSLRRYFAPELYTYFENNQFHVKKVQKEEFDSLKSKKELEKQTLYDLTGATHVFRLLTNLQKPIVGHNLLVDLMILLNCFETPIPKSYTSFKKLVHRIFPSVYDTKCLCLELNAKLEKNEKIKQSNLSDLYEYYQFGKGRHFVPNSPFIDTEDAFESRRFHNAGWDSYATGYIFIRMAHIFASKRNSSRKKTEFVFSELLDAIAEQKNKVNLIRGSINHIKIDGIDPESKRPPWLVVESSKDKQLDVTQVICHLSQFGQIAIKPLNSKWRKALLAVDSYPSARRILKATPHPDFRVQPYNPLRHSVLIRALMWGTVATSGVLTIFLFHSVLKK